MFLTQLFESNYIQLTIKNPTTLQFFQQASLSNNPFLPKIYTVDGSTVSMERLQPLNPKLLTSQTLQSLFVEDVTIDQDVNQYANTILKILAYAIRYQAHNYIINETRYNFKPEVIEAIDIIHNISSDSNMGPDLIAFRGAQLVILFPFGK